MMLCYTAGMEPQMDSKDSVLRNRLILWHWALESLRYVKPDGGVVQTTIRSPLTVEDLTEVMVKVTQHPSYEGQCFNLYAEDGTPVKVENGKVIRE